MDISTEARIVGDAVRAYNRGNKVVAKVTIRNGERVCANQQELNDHWYAAIQHGLNVLNAIKEGDK